MSKRPICLSRPRLVPPEQIAGMYPAALQILSEIGLRVRSQEVLSAAARAGMRVNGDRVFPDRSAVADLVVEAGPACPSALPAEECVPPEITYTIHTYPMKVYDLDSDQVVPFTTERVIEATKLADTCADRGLIAGAPGAPADVGPYLRTILQFKIGAQYSRNGGHYWDAWYAKSIPYVMDMAEVVGNPVHTLPVFVNSPLCIGDESLTAVMELKDRLKQVSVSNISTAGLSAPIRLADGITLGLAEVIGAAAVVREATRLPVVWGLWVSGGSPGGILERWASEEVTAFYHGKQPGPPWGIAMSSADRPGAQAAAQKMCALVFGALFGARSFLGGGNLTDEVWSPEQLMIDLEMKDYLQHILAGLDLSSDPNAIVAEVAEGVAEGIFLGLESTVQRYRETYWFPRLFNAPSWCPELFSRPELRQRAKEMVGEHLASYRYQLDPGKSRELDRIYAKAERDLANE